MAKKAIITMMLALVAMTGQAQTKNDRKSKRSRIPIIIEAGDIMFISMVSMLSLRPFYSPPMAPSSPVDCTAKISIISCRNYFKSTNKKHNQHYQQQKSE